MLSQTVACLTTGGALLLVVSGLTHAPNYRGLLASLLAHRVLPYRWARLTAQTAPLAQLVLGLAFLAALLVPSGSPALMSLTALGAGAMYLALAGYVLAVLVSVQDPTCACFGRSEQVTWFSLVRTALPLAAYVHAVFWPSHVLAAPVEWSVVGGVALATLGTLGGQRRSAAGPSADLGGLTGRG